ncbi:alpha/beta hydrolase [Paucibacter sp. TC2R-5]|uniref:alpha/beta fold hydrolase n=1 Tax=Paucibacter sp. TC2R-5 TaxID=2893555 RepID=UPI0021E3A5C1|nr:alpha/beta hydrolase [Paucibacter sp. TC2R-5]MCV2359674.1 alpha/beta hydrolase [Paucibacter sp. TC2R-5]
MPINIVSSYRPSASPFMRTCALAVLTLLATVLAGLGSAHASEAAAMPALARLHGQEIEQLSIKAPEAPGTLVFENGSRAEMEGWNAVIGAFATSAQQYQLTQQSAPGSAKAWSLFAYDRPGIGRSEATERPRDGRQIVADLRELLQQQGHKPPYVLVGHSLGGLYMQLFARQYPSEVKGLVLVDSLYPGIIKKPEDFPLYTRWAKAVFMSRMAAREIDAIHATGEAVLALPWSAQIPVTRLVNVPKGAGAIAVDFGVVNADEATIARVRALYPGAKTVVLDSDHQIQKANPEAVVQAIQEMMISAR